VSFAVAVLLVSAWASGWQRFTWGARFGTFGCAIAVLGIGVLWHHRRPSTRPSGGDALLQPTVHRTGAAVWLTVIVVATVWDILGLLTPPDQHHLTLSAIELAYRPLRALIFACWLAVGWVLSYEPMRRSRG